MKLHRKPDLLVILVIFVGLGVAISSYIQYSRANPNAPEQISLPSKPNHTEQVLYHVNFIRVASSLDEISQQKTESVNKTYQLP
ncbi:MAG: hypothetical protein GXP08_14410 [Gammaproteobacteria bacterium]|nr:hypothetical protein [Gammaproteobacteria bacterium]